MKEEFDITARALFDSLLEKSYEREETEDTNIGAYYEPPLDGLDTSNLPLLEEEDRDIVMHRDAHFGKSFKLMLEHYEDEGIAAVLDVDPSRIEFLMDLEEKLGSNLAPYLLQGADAEKVAQSIRLYKALREQKTPLVSAISELILSEEEPEVAASKAALHGPKLVEYLMQLLQTPTFYDPLFPGYGQAPMRACLALGMMKAKEAIKLMFGLIGCENFDTESAAVQALSLIGEPTKTFIISQLQSRPITKNNERAAIVASALEQDDELIEALIRELEDPAIQKIESLATYLVLACSYVPEKFRERFKQLLPKMPESVRHEMTTILKTS